VKKTLHAQVVELSTQANELNRQLDGLNGQVVELNRELNSVKDEKMVSRMLHVTHHTSHVICLQVAEMRAETATQASLLCSAKPRTKFTPHTSHRPSVTRPSQIKKELALQLVRLQVTCGV
jgi:hypothetical protein